MKRAFFVPSQEVEENQISPELKNPFDVDVAWTNSYKPSEFVVFLEITQHRALLPQSNLEISSWGTPMSYNLDMSARIKVIDIRKDTPKVILQEVISNNFYLPNKYAYNTYSKVEWGKQNFFKTPLGKAHLQFVDKIVDHISSYVLLFKST